MPARVDIHSLSGSAPVDIRGAMVSVGLLFLLALIAAFLEIRRHRSTRSLLSTGHFNLRMLGAATMLLLASILMFGVLFTRPQDGKIFGWYWTFCSVVLFCLVLLLRKDVALTRVAILDARRMVRDERLRELQETIERHGPRGPAE